MPFTRELLLLAAALIAWLGYAVAAESELQAPLFDQALYTVAVVLSGVVATRLVAIVLINGLAERVWQLQTTSLMRLVANIGTGMIVLFVILQYALDLNPTTLVTSSALITAIIGLGMQATLSALFSGVALQIEHHVGPDDVVRVDGGVAKIEHIGWRSIAARRLDGSLVIVPNTFFAANAVQRIQPRAPFRTELMVPAPLSVPPARTTALIAEIVAAVPGVSSSHPVTAELFTLNVAEGIGEFRVRFFSHPEDIEDDPLLSLIRMRVWYAYQRNGIVLPRSRDFPDPKALSPLVVSAVVGTGPLPQHLLPALAASRHWANTDPVERERLARSGRRLLYAPGERILLPRELDGAIVLVAGGEVRATAETAHAPEWIEPQIGAAVERPVSVVWDFATLQRVEAQLAEIIGPYAQLAVRRAAQATTHLPALYERLSFLIEKPAARAVFLDLAPRQTVHDFGPGSVFRVRARGAGHAAPGGPLTAIGEAELVIWPGDDLAVWQPEETAVA